MTQLNVVDTAKKLWSSKDEIAKNIWLAGLGAYGKSIDEANKVSDKSSTLFEELVAKGTKIEESAKAKLSDKKILANFFSFAKFFFEFLHRRKNMIV